MTDQIALTVLEFDARPAQRGAELHKAAGEKIIATDRAIEAANAKIADRIGIATNRIATSLSTQSRQLDSLARRFDPLGAAVRKAASDLAFLERTAQGAGENAQRAAGLISSAQQRLVAAQKAVAEGHLSNAAATGRLTGAVGGLQNAWGVAGRAAAAFGVTLGVGAILNYAKHVIDTVGGLGELADQLGISTQALQAYQFAAAQGGVKQEQLQAGIVKFSQKIGEAAAGSKEMIDALDRLGIKILDVQGNLRPTEDLLTEAARRITEIEDPARRAAAAVDLFGKAGAKFLPILSEIAKGQRTLLQEANAAGFGISPETIDRLDKFSDAIERYKLAATAGSANVLAQILTGADRVAAFFENTWNDVVSGIDSGITAIVGSFSGLSAAIGNVMASVAGIIEGKFRSAINSVIEFIEGAANEIAQKIGGTALGRRLGITGEQIYLGRVGSKADGITPDFAPGRAYNRGYEDAVRQFNIDKAALEYLKKRENGATDVQARAAARGDGLGGPVTVGARNPTIRGGGGGESQDRIGKTVRDAEMELEWAQKIAEASRIGSAAVSDLQMQFDAAKKAAAAFGDQADKNKAGVDALAKKLYEAARANDTLKKATAFNLQTEEIERGNQLLEAELRLLDAAPEVRAREIALIRVKNQLEKDGLSTTDVEYQRRLDAVTAQEELNRRLEDARKQQESFAEPFKNGVQSLQGFITEGLMGGFKNAREGILGIWKRLIVELGVATVIRPLILAPAVSLLGATGLVPQSVVSQFGGGSIFGGPAGTSVGGGGGLGGIFGGGGGGGLFGGGFGDFFSRPLFGSFGGMSPSSFEGVIPGLSGSEALNFFASQSGAPTLSLGGLLGGIGSIGFGALNLAQGNTIGGAAGILGGGLGLLGAAVPALSFLGPIGMGIGLIGGILGGVLGKKKVKTPQGVSNLKFDDGQWSTSKAMSRGAGNLSAGTGKAGDMLGDQIDQLATTYGLAFSDDAIGGYILNSIGKNTGNQWQVGLGAYRSGTPLPEEYVGKYGKAPNALQGLGSPEEAVGLLAGLIFKANADSGALSGLSATQRIALDNADITAIEDIKQLLDFSQVYDDLSRGAENVTAMEKAIREINLQFRAGAAQAKDYGLSTALIEQRRKEAINKLATDMNNDFRRRLLGMTPEGARDLALEDNENARQKAIKEAQYLNQTVTGALVDINQIELYYAKQRTQIIEQANAQATATLDTLFRRLSYGDLSGASPLTALSGARGTYEATLAQAQAGDLAARGNLAGAAEDYIRAQIGYTGNNSDFETLRLRVLADIAPFTSVANDNTLTAINSNILQASNLLLSLQTQAQNTQLQFERALAALAESANENVALRMEIRRLVGLVENRAA